MSTGDSCTPVYQLPFPTGQSNPCNVGTTLCDFDEAVEVQLDSLDDIVDRTAGTLPFAYIMNSGDMSYNNNLIGPFFPFFDTILADTANMVDLSLDDTSIYFTIPGVYALYVSCELTLPPGATSLQVSPLVRDVVTTSQVSLNNDYFIGNYSTSASMPVKNTGGRLDNSCFTGEYMFNAQVGHRYTFEVTVGGSVGITTTIHEFRAGALWLRDPL